MMSSLRTPFLVIGLFVLSAHAQNDPRQKLAGWLKEVPGARSDAARDSLNVSIKAVVRELLERIDGLTLDFSEVPISRVDAPDGTFRLITWNIPRMDGSHHYEGFLLRRSGRGALLTELKDATATITAPEVPELGAERWYGALYYEVIPVRKGGKVWYTLLGWKGHSKVETRKVIDVLHFKGNRPRFGAPLFGAGRIRSHRQVFGYSFQATMMLRFEKQQGRIVLDHLSPTRPDMEGQRAYYGPDLSYDAYIWDKDHWRFERDIDARDLQRPDRPYNTPPAQPRP